MRSIHCVVSGKVQGVYFRTWVFDQAQSLGVKGWIRNLQEGKVEILGQGDEAVLNELKKRLMDGSSLSRVEHMEFDWTDYDKEYSAFEIRG